MQLKLTPHPEFACAAIHAIEVTVERSAPSAITFAYRAVGPVADVFLPPPAEPAHTDELWRTTCFEAFLKPEGGAGYVELNFAPSGRWAAYRFTSFRAGMTPLEIAAPRIEMRRGAEALELDVAVDLSAHLPPGPCRLAVTAVIEETNGARSYWALAHAPGRPDFHAAEGFAAVLPSPRGGGDAKHVG